MRWETDQNVLRAIYEIEQEVLTDQLVELDNREIAARSGVEPPQLTWIIGQLHAGGYIEVIDSSSIARRSYDVTGITPKGLEAIAEWPSPSAVAAILPRLLEDLAADREDPDERNALQRIAENVTTGAFTALVVRHFPWLQ